VIPRIFSQWSEAIGFEKVNNDLGEFVGFFEIHEMTGVGNNDSPGIRNTRFDCPGVRMNVRNVGITYQY
jgi:hypothetical protein